ncbi:ABC transporter permease [Sphingorhabdus lutea]|uniref:ABC transporter permease n=1 Tax=Sphingorhabdus lutea TaxID=1913578 RepID=A0A1L3JAS0_9SPHN|nr:iron ABC transporter permease [Sphingorhabdus lutea]APG62227.1 ABC transporter permease [Sphingorhabdus lutea]
MKLNLGLFSLLILAMLAALFAGKIWVPVDEIFGGGRGALIIAELRTPRIILGVIIGGALGLSGAVMQGYLRNPLADPGLFGVSSGAALGAVIAIFWGLAGEIWALPLFALIGAGGSMALLGMLAGRSGSLILITLGGVMLSTLTGSLTALVISLAPTPFATSQIITWLMGALSDRSWSDVYIAAPLIFIGMMILFATARALDVLTLGDVVARSMGVDMVRLQWQVILGTGICVGAAVAAAGVIGFVGLMVPHIIRPFVGHRPSALLLPSALAGAILIISSDALVRILPTVSELRLGIAMTMLGTPFFLFLLFKMRRGIM